MKSDRTRAPYALLSQLWLHEPDEAGVARATESLGLPHAEPDALAPAYADTFLLNVHPYGTAYTDARGELNTPEAERVAALYAAHGYQPAALAEVGAPDHLGLGLGFLAHLGEVAAARDFVRALAAWAPVCCLAVEREPQAHPFYRSLALRTREALLSALDRDEAAPLSGDVGAEFNELNLEDAEIRLRDVVRYFLAPARCGLFLSRSRLGNIARGLGLRLPFGSRLEVAEALFTAAGEGEAIGRLLDALRAEAEAWALVYQECMQAYPAWHSAGHSWLARISSARQRLTEMHVAAQANPQ